MQDGVKYLLQKKTLNKKFNKDPEKPLDDIYNILEISNAAAKKQLLKKNSQKNYLNN